MELDIRFIASAIKFEIDSTSIFLALLVLPKLSIVSVITNFFIIDFLIFEIVIFFYIFFEVLVTFFVVTFFLIFFD